MDDDSLLLYTGFILATAFRQKKDKKIKVKRKEWIKGWLANRAFESRSPLRIVSIIFVGDVVEARFTAPSLNQIIFIVVGPIHFETELTRTINSCLSLDSHIMIISPLNAHDILYAQKFASRGTLIRGSFDLS